MRNLIFIICIFLTANCFSQSNDNKPKIFNVKLFGAKGDSSVDDAPSIQLAINACFSAGGGIVFFPNGVYNISSALITSLNSVNPNCQLYVPLTVQGSIGIAPTVKLMGETPPNFNTSGLTSWAKDYKGAVLRSTIIGSGTNPSVIGSSWQAVAFGNWNNTQLSMENLTVRVKSKSSAGADTIPTMGGINATNIELFDAVNVLVDNESPSFDAVEPTFANTGISMPQVNNNAWSYLNRVMVSNYNVGINVAEHTNADNLFINTCVNGVSITTNQNHLITLNHLLITWCRYNITSTAIASVNISNAALEDYNNAYGSKWYLLVYDLRDSLNKLTGDFNYLRVVSNVGVVQLLTNNGAKGVNKNSIYIPNIVSQSERQKMVGSDTTTSTGTGQNIGSSLVFELNRNIITSTSDYFPDLVLTTKQNGTANITGRIVFDNPQSSLGDKRLVQLWTNTDGSKDKGNLFISLNNGTSLQDVAEFHGEYFQIDKNLKLRVGTATAGTSPLLFQPIGSVLLTTPVTGVTETDTSNLYYSSGIGLNLKRNIIATWGYTAATTTYTALLNDKTIDCTGGGTFTITLPLAATAKAGKVYYITNSGVGTITISTSSSETFTNVTATPTSISIIGLGSAQIQSTGSAWLQLK